MFQVSVSRPNASCWGEGGAYLLILDFFLGGGEGFKRMRGLNRGTMVFLLYFHLRITDTFLSI